MARLDLTQQQLLHEAHERRAAPLSPRERLAERITGTALVLAGATLWLLFDVPDVWHPLPAAACLAAYVVAMRVRFDVAGIYTTPGQLASIPLLFTLPPQAVPPVTVLALAASRLPDVVRREAPAGRLWLSVANAWFTIGPATVLLLAGTPSAAEASVALVASLLGAQIATDFVASAFRESLSRGARLREQFADAIWVYGVDAALTPVAMLGAAEIGRGSWMAFALLPLVLLLGSLSRERTRRLEGVFALTRAYRGMALVLGDVVEADDRYTGEHCKDVVTLSMRVGRRMALDAERLRNLEFGALLHDVGKIAVPKAIINKPGELTHDEFEIVKRHTIEGQRMLDHVGGFMRDVGVIVRHHHERWDGQGYPDRLGGKDIPRGGADRGVLRHAERDDHRSPLPPGAPARDGDRGAAPLRGHPVRSGGRRRGARAPGGARVRRDDGCPGGLGAPGPRPPAPARRVAARHPRDRTGPHSRSRSGLGPLRYVDRVQRAMRRLVVAGQTVAGAVVLARLARGRRRRPPLSVPAKASGGHRVGGGARARRGRADRALSRCAARRRGPPRGAGRRRRLHGRDRGHRARRGRAGDRSRRAAAGLDGQAVGPAARPRGGHGARSSSASTPTSARRRAWRARSAAPSRTRTGSAPARASSARPPPSACCTRPC